MAIQAQYEMPVTGTLMVQIGEEIREATEDDLVKMDFVRRGETYKRFRSGLIDALAADDILPHDLVDAKINPLRYLAELASYPDAEPLQRAVRDQLGIDIRAIERVLRLVATGHGLEANDLWQDYVVARETDLAAS